MMYDSYLFFFGLHSPWTLCHDFRQVNGLLFEHRNPKALEEQMRRCVFGSNMGTFVDTKRLFASWQQRYATGNHWKYLKSWTFLAEKSQNRRFFLLSADKVVKRRSDSFNQRPRGRNRAALRGSDWPSQDFKCQAADFVAMACHFWHESRWLQFALWHVRGFLVNIPQWKLIGRSKDWVQGECLLSLWRRS